MERWNLEQTPRTTNEFEWVYNGLDCLVTYEVYKELINQLNSRPENVKRTYMDALAKQAPVMDMEMRGIRLDIIRKEKILRELRNDLIRIQAHFDKLCVELIGYKINSRSPKQLKDLLYGHLKLPVQRAKSANGLWVESTNRTAREKLTKYFHAIPFLTHLNVLADLNKQISFLNTKIDEDNRFRCSLNVAGTVTGRLSSAFSDFGTGSNLQNIDRRLRIPFVPDNGYIFLSIDLEQADSRNFGALAWNFFYQTHGEEFAGSYLNACEGGDLHTTVAQLCWPDLEWTNDVKYNKTKIASQLIYRQDSYRQVAKKNGHGTNYLSTPKTLAFASDLPVQLVNVFQEKYFQAFPCIKATQERIINQLLRHPQLTTLFGRTRNFHDRVTNQNVQREAVAFMGQSPTAHQIDIGFLQAWRRFPWIELLIQVHDSILMQIPKDKVDRVDEILEAMKVVLPLAGGRDFSVPLEAKLGMNWGDKSEDNPNGLTTI